MADLKLDITKQNNDLHKELEQLKKIENSIYNLVQNDLYSKINKLGDQIYIANQNIKTNKEILISLLRKTEKIFLIGTSEHDNMGDSCITLGEIEFIKNYYPNKIIIEVSTYEYDDYFPIIKEIITQNDMIFLQGGGNLGDKFLIEEKLRRKVVSSFTNNKIVILPQTIYFLDPNGKELKESQKVYHNHKNLILFVRGKKSLNYAKKYFPNVYSYIGMDLTTYLKRDYNYERKGILACIRDLNDESGLNKKVYEELLDLLYSLDHNYDKSNNIYKENIKKLNKNNIVENELKFFAKHEVVITDRLHGLIFSIITKTPCIVLSSYNKKINEFVEQISNSKGIVFVDKDILSIKKAYKEIIKNKIQPEYPDINSDSFDNIFKIISEN